MHTLNLHQLATFQIVAKYCSFVQAAEELRDEPTCGFRPYS